MRKESKQADEAELAAMTDAIDKLSRPEQAPLVLTGDEQERYMRFARAAARLRTTGDAHMKAQDEYKQALGLLSASAEKLATGNGQTEPV